MIELRYLEKEVNCSGGKKSWYYSLQWRRGHEVTNYDTGMYIEWGPWEDVPHVGIDEAAEEARGHGGS